MFFFLALTLLTREMQVMNQGLGSLERQVEMLQVSTNFVTFI